jgi:hypothetical protein
MCSAILESLRKIVRSLRRESQALLVSGSGLDGRREHTYPLQFLFNIAPAIRRTATVKRAYTFCAGRVLLSDMTISGVTWQWSPMLGAWGTLKGNVQPIDNVIQFLLSEDSAFSFGSFLFSNCHICFNLFAIMWMISLCGTGVQWSASYPGRFTPWGKRAWYPLCRRLGGHYGEENISVPTGNRTSTTRSSSP